MAVTALKKLQIGKESAFGTSVAATAVLLGTVIDAQPIQDVAFPSEERGILAKNIRSYVQKRMATAKIDTEATYEQIMYFLAGLKGSVAATTVTGVSTWLYARNLAARNFPQFYTLEYGNDQQAYKLTSALMTSLDLSLSAGAPWKLSASYDAQDMATTTFTASLSQPVVETALGGLTKLYFNVPAVSPTWGSAVASTLIDASIKLKTGNHVKHFADGQLTPSSYGEDELEGSFDLTFEFNTAGVAERAAFDALAGGVTTTRLIRLASAGSNIPASTPTTAKSFTLDFAGVYNKVEPLGNRDGNQIIKISGMIVYDPTWAKDILATVVNGVPTLI